MASRASKQKDNTINIHSYPVQMHVGSQKFVNDDWGTIAYIIDRREVQNKFADPELRYNCIYFLFGYENNMEMCYVGQAKIRNDGESVLARLREHDKSTTEKYRDIWDWAVVVTNKNGSWTLDDLNALEHAFYAEIPVEQNLNGNNPNAGGADFDSYIDKIEQIKALVTTIGFSIFAKKTQTENIQVTSETNEFSIVEDLQNGMARIPEIVTPHKVVKAMVDMIPADVWNDRTVFLDPACKGGEYLREIYDRLMENEVMQSKYPNDIERSNHILSEQLYGIALSQVSLERTTKKLMGFGMNIRVIPNYIEILKTKFDKEVSEAYKYEYIMNILNKEFGKTMNIDVVIGNPPYQESTDGGKNGGKALWNRFIESSIRIQPTYIDMITPSRWFTGGQGLNQFRIDWINDKHIRKIVHFPNANVVFPGTSIAGGVSYFLWDKHKNDNVIKYKNELTLEETDRILNKFDIFITNNIEEGIAEKIVDNIKANKINTMDTIVGSGGMYGLPTNWRELVGDIQVITSDGIYYCDIDDIKEKPVGYRVVVSNVMSEHAGESSKDGTYKVITTVQIADPNTVTAGHYVPIGPFNNIDSAVACAKYIKSKTLRLLLRMRAVGIGITTDCYKFIPIQNFSSNSDIDWSQSIADIDKQLYKKYNLSEKEIAYIENTIKPME